MKTTNLTTAFLVLALGLMAWAGIVYFMMQTYDARETLAGRLVSAQGAEQKLVTMSVQRVVARQTKTERSEFSAFADTDIVRFADLVESTGKKAGVDISLTGASQGTPAAGLPTANVVIDASGNFASVMQAANLLETLPAPVSIQYLEFQRTTDDKGKAVWTLKAHLRLLAESDDTSSP